MLIPWLRSKGGLRVRRRNRWRLAVEALEERLAPALVAAYAFNEGTGTTVADATGNGHTGTIANATWSTAGMYGNALSFNGTNARVNIPDATALHLTTAMTLEAWVDPSAAPHSWQDVVYKGNDNYYLESSSDPNNAPVAGATVGSADVGAFGTSALLTNTWNFLTETYDGTTIRLYVNGVQAASLAKSGSLVTSTNALQIGGDSIYGQYFKGLIDNVRVYNVALTVAQVQADMATPIAPGTPPPTAPASLSANAGGTTITLNWTGSSGTIGVSSYLVERENPGSTTFVQIGTATGTTYSDAGLAANSTYSYRVRASDWAGNLSAYSNLASATTQPPDTIPPTAPSNLTATASGFQINLSWTASTDNNGVSGYFVERENPGSTAFVQIGTTTGTTYSDSGLAPSSVYSYRVRASDTSGNLSGYSNVAGATTAAALTVLGSTVDSNGVVSYSVVSPYLGSQPQTLRILKPTHPAPGQPPRFLYLLPVLAGLNDAATYGDGLQTAEQLDAQDQYNATLVAPSFPINPWYADSATDPTLQLESFMVKALVPWVNQTQPAPGTTPAQWLVGFSKSGFGALDLILRNPNVFDAAACWDAPAQTTDVTTFSDMLANYGTQQNFANYEIPTLVTQDKAPFQTTNRIWISGDNALYTSQMVTLDQQMTAAGIKHTFVGGVTRTHTWTSGWLPLALQGLAPPVAIAGPNVSGNEGSPIQFNGTASGGTLPLTYAWTFGDGGTANTLTPTHTYASDGTYTATLTVTDSANHTSTSTTTATVNNVAPTVSAGGPYTGNPGTAISFSGTATVPDPKDTFTYLWNFGDGGTSTLQNPTHTYTTTNTYTVTLQATDSEGASTTSASTTATVAPPSPPVANAGPNVSGNEGSAIQFNGSVSGGTGTLTYAWTFGDNGTTNTLTPTHTYASDGTYTATLTITDSANNTSTSTTTATVNNVAPTVSAGGPYTGNPGTAISFSGTATVPDPKDTFTYLWNFGDAGTSTLQNPSHTYTTTNTYTVTLQATDSEGASTTASTTATVAISGLVAAYAFDAGTGTTVADASGNGHTGTIVNATWSTAGKYGDALSFNGTNARVDIPDATALHLTTGMTLEAWVSPSAAPHSWQDVLYKGNDNYYLESSSDPNNAPVAGATVGSADVGANGTTALPTNTWSFLTETYDGTTIRLYVNGVQVASLAKSGSLVTSTNPLQIGGDSIYGQYFQGLIDNIRIYNVALTTAQIQADMNTPTASLPPPVANAGPNVSGNEGSAIQFNGTASGGTGTLTYSWAFGDGSTILNTLTPSHAYASDGTYTATLTVTDSANNTASSSTTVTVNNVAPTVSAGGPYTGNPGTAISFSGTATVPDSKDTFTYLWNFGDGGTSTLQNPTHTYTTTNTYTVTLQATDSEGASTTSASTTATVTPPSPPVANAGPNVSGNEGSAIQFNGTASGGTGTLTYAWTFGDGGTANTLTPKHTYASDGTYTATLTVTDSANNTSTSTTTATVNNVAPTVSAGGPYTGNLGIAISFSGTVTVPDPKDTLTYLWNFGDGGTSTLQNPTHTYTTANTYTVTLQATDSEGTSTTASTTATVTPVVTGLVATYAFDAGTGTTVADASGNGHTGTIVNATWSTAGKYGDALSFNGTNARVDIPDATALHLTTGMTLEAWVNPSAAPHSWQDVIYKGNDNYYLESSSDPNNAPAAGATVGSADVGAFGSATLPINTWTFLTETYDGTTIRLYINGVQAASLAQSGSLVTSANALQIGGDSLFGQYFQGLIDNVRVYNAALTTAEVQADMGTPITPGTPPPTAPASLSATASGGTITLTWAASSDLIGVSYVVERENPGSSSFDQIGTATGTTYRDTGLTDNSTYSYEVQAVDWAGNTSGFSNVASATAQFGITPHSATLQPGQTQPFAANLTGVIWSVNGVAGGSASTGTITSAGLYTAPTSLGTYTVTGTTPDGLHSDSASIFVTNYSGTLTERNDNLRTGANLNETILTPANVNSTQFGKLFSYSLDGIAFASPLYVPHVNIPGMGYHNVVYVATEHDSVYAFDADGLTTTPLWHVSFINPSAGITPIPAADTLELVDIPIEVGITGTPVIDPTTGTIYLVADTKVVVNGTTTYYQTLHALDITTGAEKFGGPVVIQGAVPGTGTGSSNGMVPFSAVYENQHAGLLLSNGVVYIPFASHGSSGTAPFWHGWVFGYNASTLHQVMVYNDTANANGGGIWMGADGLASDSTGNIYFTSGNGTFDANTGGVDYGDSAVKLSPSGQVLDYFTPYNQATLDSQDQDLASGGVLLLPTQSGSHPDEMVFGGKEGTVYVANRDNMGHYNSTNNNQIVQSLVNVFTGSSGGFTGNFSSPVYYNGYVYFAPVGGTVQAFQVTNGLLSTALTSQSAESDAYPGGMIAISANGASNGILWAVQRNGTTSSGVLFAYDATNLAHELYNSNQAGFRDTMDPAAKFDMPAVANGKVYVAGVTQLTVYGLLSQAPMARLSGVASEPGPVPAAGSAPGGKVTPDNPTTAPSTGYSPAQIKQAYGIAQLGSSKPGSGETIAIVDAYLDPAITQDLAAFDAKYGLAAPPSFKILNDGATWSDPTGGWELETALDVEWAHAIAPYAEIVLVEAANDYVSPAGVPTALLDAVSVAARQANVVSMSWGVSEFPGEPMLDAQYFTTPNVTFVAASGDSGYGTIWPAVSPDVVAVGGTSLLLTTSGTYGSETGWGNGFRSARLGGSGGGISRFETKPAYQQSGFVSSVQSSMRTTPDVAYDANPSTGVSVYDATNGGWLVVGGTSAGTPGWAALVALADQVRALANPAQAPLSSAQTLAALYSEQGDFHDITSGNNGYAAALGYDLVTGLGTPEANKLIPALAALASVAATIATTTAAPLDLPSFPHKDRPFDAATMLPAPASPAGSPASSSATIGLFSGSLFAQPSLMQSSPDATNASLATAQVVGPRSPTIASSSQPSISPTEATTGGGATGSDGTTAPDGRPTEQVAGALRDEARPAKVLGDGTGPFPTNLLVPMTGQDGGITFRQTVDAVFRTYERYAPALTVERPTAGLQGPTAAVAALLLATALCETDRSAMSRSRQRLSIR